MAARDGARALASAGCAAKQEQLGAALVAALELALLAAHRLLGELDNAAGRHPEAAVHLEQAQALAASATLANRALALSGLAAPRVDTGEPAEARGRLDQQCTGPGPLEARPVPNRNEICEVGGSRGLDATSACRAGLTRRELEVLRLIAAGRSNREIAAALYLSPRTAERHVANIYLKIGAHSKAEAAAYALRHDLA